MAVPSGCAPSNDAPVQTELYQTQIITLANGIRIAEHSPGPALYQLHQACRDGSLAEAEQILARITPLPTVGDLPFEADYALARCLEVAVEQKHRDLIRAMLQHGFRIYPVAVLTAVRAADTATLKIFIDYGWDVDGGKDDGRPPLHYAVLANLTDLRRFLLAHGAGPNIADHRGLTALDFAAGSSSIEVVRELLEHGGNPALDDSLIHAAGHGRLDVAQLLLEQGAAVNAWPKQLPLPWGGVRRANALEAAMLRNHQHMIQWLRNHGATAKDGSLNCRDHYHGYHVTG